MQVSNQIKARVNARIAQCAEIVRQAYPHAADRVPVPSIRYDINSAGTAGLAYRSERIRLNPAFLLHHTDHYIEQTVAHEYAHCAVYAMHGRVQSHGPEWKNMMRLLGIPPDRCHEMELPEGVRVGKPKQKFGYHCGHCNEPMAVGPVTHKKIQRGATFWHKKCGKGRGNLVFSQQLGRVNHSEAKRIMERPKVAQPAAKAAAPVVPVQPGITIPAPKVTKIQLCRQIMDRFPNADRKTLIAKFVENGCTPAGALSYYYRLVK